MLILPKKVSELVDNHTWVFVMPDGALYNPKLEAHPLDPTTSYSSASGKSYVDPFASQLIAAVNAAKAAEAAEAEGKTRAALAEAMVMETSTAELESVMQSLTLDNPLNPVSQIINFDELWTNYATEVINMYF